MQEKVTLDLSKPENANFNLGSFNVFDIKLEYLALKNLKLTREADRVTLLKIEEMIQTDGFHKPELSFSGTDEEESRSTNEHGYSLQVEISKAEDLEMLLKMFSGLDHVTFEQPNFVSSFGGEESKEDRI